MHLPLLCNFSLLSIKRMHNFRYTSVLDFSLLSLKVCHVLCIALVWNAVPLYSPHFLITLFLIWNNQVCAVRECTLFVSAIHSVSKISCSISLGWSLTMQKVASCGWPIKRYCTLPPVYQQQRLCHWSTGGIRAAPTRVMFHGFHCLAFTGIRYSCSQLIGSSNPLNHIDIMADIYWLKTCSDLLGSGIH